MPTEYIAANSIGPGIRVPFVVNTDYHVLAGVTVASTNNSAMSGAFAPSVFVQGTVAGDVHGISLGLAAQRASVFVDAMGAVRGSDGSAIVLNDGDLTLTNLGTISSAGSFGLFMSTAAEDLNLVNRGTISGFGGLSLGGATAYVENHGLISARESGAGNAVVMFSAGTFINTGTVTGEIGSIFFGNGSQTLINTGTLIGDVSMGGGADVFDGRGGSVLGGSINGTSGADILYGGITADRLDGGSDDDVIHFSIEDARVNGGDGLDSAFNTYHAFGLTFDMGFNSIEYYYGSEAGETILTTASAAMNVDAGGGNDLLLGGSGTDFLFGNGGDDVILGGQGVDDIAGGLGDDRVESGAGDDLINGGVGADTFVFQGVGGGNDTISGFEIGRDKIEILRSGFLSPTQWNAGGLDPARFVASANPTPNLTTPCFLFDNAGPGAGQVFWNDGMGGATGIFRVTGINFGFFSAQDFVLV